MLSGCAGGGELCDRPGQFRGLRVTGILHGGEASVQVRPWHALPDAVQRLIGPLILQCGRGGLHRQPLPVCVAELGTLVPGGQLGAGVRAYKG